MFGQPAKKELCYENLKVTTNAWDSNIIQCNGKYLSVNWQASGGGAFAIIPVGEVGKAPDTPPLFRGHKAPVLDTAFNPFNLNQVASCSDDGKILIWNIPEDYSFHKYFDDEDNVIDITEPFKVLSGHSKKVGHLEFHPCAENVLASCSLDYTVKVWNLDSGKDVVTLPHKDLVTSFAFNYNGTRLATTSRDKKLRVWDVLTGEIISEGPGHTGAKPSRIIWLGNTDRVLTTGFSRLSDRQIAIWDASDISKGPIDGFLVLDASSGVLIPSFDAGTNILYLAGKGDGNIRYYEYDNDILYELSQYGSTEPQRGFAVAPKRSVNVKENEVLRAYKTVKDTIIEPISFIVPRRSELFQDDIYPDCPSTQPALTAEEFFSGKKVNGPLLMDMRSIFEGTEATITLSAAAVDVSKAKEEAAKEKKEAAKLEDVKEKAASSAKSSPAPSPAPVSASRSSTPKNVDDVLKSSDKVDSLLNKVNDKSDDDDDKFLKSSTDDDWEEVKKPEESKLLETKSIIEKEPVKKEEPKVEEPKVEEPKVEPKKEEPKEEPKVETKKEEPKAEPKREISSSSTKSTAAPTLKQTVERLAGLVDRLESQVTVLTEAALKKDDRINQLEDKLDQILKK